MLNTVPRYLSSLRILMDSLNCALMLQTDKQLMVGKEITLPKVGQ